MTVVEEYEDCRRRYMEASWLMHKGEDSYESYKKWREQVPIFQKELSGHVQMLLRLQHTGDVEVMNALGDALQMGFGIKKNREEAIDRFRFAAQAGHTQAMVRLGRILAHDDLKQLEESCYWFQKAADAGDASGMVALGFAFREGTGVRTDYVKAAEWFSKAVDAGDKSAKHLLAKLYYFNMDATDKALPLLLEEAERDNPDSFKTLARIYGDDLTNQYDFEKAVYWYERIANGKYEGAAHAARMALAELHLSGKRQPKNIAKAKEYLEAVVSNSPDKSGYRKDALKVLGKIEKGKA